MFHIISHLKRHISFKAICIRVEQPYRAEVLLE